jgi:hypothetical protein
MEQAATLVAAIAAFVTALATLRLVKAAKDQLGQQTRSAQEAARLATLWHLEEVWMSPQMLRRRKAAAEAIAANRHDPNSYDLDHVLDFLDMVGFLLRKGIIDKELAWHRFYHPAIHYWLLARGYIEDERKDAPKIWEDYVSLVGRMMELEEATVTEADLEDFLTGERQDF